MINIQKSQIVYYDGGSKKVTVYFDFDPAVKKMYVVPLPKIVRQGNEPVFSLTKYVKNQGKVNGMCVFDVELHIPDDARTAVQNTFPDYVFGQFDWVSALSFFSYDVAGELQEISATPSMYGDNRVTFSIEITSNEMLQTFINAFKGGESLVSPFHVQYQLSTLTKLTGVTATVSYDASVAVEYQQKLETKTDTWGNSHTVVTEVKKNLRQSGAGKVVISWNVPPTPELELTVNDWAWATLEKMVTQAVTTADKAATESVPVTATSSFTQHYQEDQVIEWVINSEDALERFDEGTWKKVFREVDLQQLVVTFNTLGDYSKPDGGEVVEKIEITITYGNNAPFTFALFPTDNTKNSFTYVSNGDFASGSFNSEYKYKYVVSYNGMQPFISEELTSSDTLVTLNPSLLGIRNVTFIGADIPFTGSQFTGAGNSKTVNRVIIDFYFTRPEGVPNKTEQKILEGNGINNKQVFASFYNLPLENTYAYRYTFHFNDNTSIAIDTVPTFGSENRDQLLVLFPYQKQEFALKAMKVKTDPVGFAEIDVTVQYKDAQNSISESTDYSWQPDFGSKILVQSTPWQFLAPTNLESAYYEINGQIILDDGDVRELNDYRQNAKFNSLLFKVTETPYTITIDSSLVDWNAVFKLQVNVFQVAAGSIMSKDLTPYYLFSLPAGHVESRIKRRMVSESRRNELSFWVTPPPTQTPPPPYTYYNIQRPNSATSLSFYIGAEYAQKDGTVKYLDVQEITSKTKIILPPNGNTSAVALAMVQLNMVDVPVDLDQ